MTRVLVAIPEFGAPELTDAVLGDLLADDPGPGTRLVVVDNGGSYAGRDARVEVHRPGVNLRWIGATNWALSAAIEQQASVCVVINNDTRLSPGFLAALTRPFVELDRVAVVAACYDDFWLHQRARVVPPSAAAYEPARVFRDVPFCDGTALAFSVPAVAELGLLDTDAFPRHGYGSDIDFALRARDAGWRCVVTEEAYVAHLRRATMNRVGQTAEDNRAEILTGMDAKWGADWRARAGLGPGAFPPHNTGSGESWYLEVPVHA